jgi:hypothetical protein
MAEEYCANPECDCEVEPEKAISKGDEEYYCSQHCANRETSASDECECGHPACG